MGQMTTPIAFSALYMQMCFYYQCVCVLNELAAYDFYCLALLCFKNVLCEFRSWIEDRIKPGKSAIVLDSAVQIIGTMEREL